MISYSVFVKTHKYKNVTEFIKKICLCDMDIIKAEKLITYESLVQEDIHKYHDLVNSNRWGSASGKEKSQDQTLLPNEHTLEI